MDATPILSDKTCLDIIREYLIAYGYDGLYNPDDSCGCEVDDLEPCGNRYSNLSSCMPGYRRECTHCDEYGDERHWVIQKERP